MAVTRLLIRGPRVQGVGFRWWIVQTATRLGLDGWVRNRNDGSVELLAAGAAKALDQLEAACRQGPSGARVSEVTTLPAREEPPAGFRARPTA